MRPARGQPEWADVQEGTGTGSWRKSGINLTREVEALSRKASVTVGRAAAAATGPAPDGGRGRGVCPVALRRLASELESEPRLHC